MGSYYIISVSFIIFKLMIIMIFNGNDKYNKLTVNEINEYSMIFHNNNYFDYGKENNLCVLNIIKKMIFFYYLNIF